MKNLPELERNRLLDNQPSGLFSGKYLKFQNGAPVSVHCKRCNVQVAGYAPVIQENGEVMMLTGPEGKKVQAVAMKRFNNHAKVRLIMKMPDKIKIEMIDDKETAHITEGREFEVHPIVCSDCHKVLGDDHKLDLWAVVLNGWHLELEAKGSSDEEMEAYFKMFKGAIPLRVEQISE